jgi:hypothetical protein
MIEEFILITGGFLFGVIMTSVFWLWRRTNNNPELNDKIYGLKQATYKEWLIIYKGRNISFKECDTKNELIDVVLDADFLVRCILKMDNGHHFIKTIDVTKEDVLVFEDSEEVKEQKARENGTYTFDSQKDFEEWVNQEKAISITDNPIKFTVD